jgi:hypothetical protein
MKSVTLAVIFAGLVTYGTTYSPPASSVIDHNVYASHLTESPPLFTDPDDEEEDRIMPPNKRKNRRFI